MATEHFEQAVQIPIDSTRLEGSLATPGQSKGLVVFAHGSGSSRFSPRNNYVAKILRQAGIGTLLMDLLTEQEDSAYETRFNIDLLTERLLLATRWVQEQPRTKDLQIGYFGASTRAASALKAAAIEGSKIGAVGSRVGRAHPSAGSLPPAQSPHPSFLGCYDTLWPPMNLS